MSEQKGYSPSFKHPTEIMRLRRRRRASSRGTPGASDPGQGAPSPGSLRPFSPGHGAPSPGSLRPFSPGHGAPSPGSLRPFSPGHGAPSPGSLRPFSPGHGAPSPGSLRPFSPGHGAPSPGSLRPFSPGPLFSGGSAAGGVKRRNPFANIENTFSPSKKLMIYKEEEEAEMSTTKGFSERLREAETTEPRKSLDFSEDDSLFEEKEEDLKSPLLKSPPAVAPASIAPPVCRAYPADWSLKTRMLVTSPLSLTWADKPRALEEAQGISQHCRASFSALPQSIPDPKSCSALRSCFQQSLVYWQHPSLPWISLFPRINAERSFRGKSAPWSDDSTVQQSLMSEWSVSLSSVYSLLKSKLCPYFYICSYQFTVLFKAAGLGGSKSITAQISPTTRGLREALKAEGIEFSLPLVEELRRSRDHDIDQELDSGKDKSDDCCEGKEEEDGADDEDGTKADNNDDDDDDEDMSWLKEMGVQDKIRKPDSISIQLRKEGQTVSLDHKPESVVVVRGADTFTLVNFLINYRALVASAGSQAGLPPTLLCPVAFRGATMQTLKARSVNVKSQVGGGFQNISSLEVKGPVLPSSLHAMTSLLRLSQKGNFSASLFTHAPTAAMNAHKNDEQIPDPEDLSSCGISCSSVKQLQSPSTLGKTALNHLHMSNYSYAWKN